MRRQTMIFILLGVSVTGMAVITSGQERRASPRATASTEMKNVRPLSSRVMRVRDLPPSIREKIRSSSYPPQCRVEIKNYDLNHDGQAERVISALEVYFSHEGEVHKFVDEPGSRMTWFFARDGSAWRELLGGISGNIKAIRSNTAGEYDDIEQVNNGGLYIPYRSSDPFILRRRLIGGRYKVYECRDSKSGQVVPCSSIRVNQADRTLKDAGYDMADDAKDFK